MQSIVQFNVVHHIKDNTIGSNSIGCGTAWSPLETQNDKSLKIGLQKCL